MNLRLKGMLAASSFILLSLFSCHKDEPVTTQAQPNANDYVDASFAVFAKRNLDHPAAEDSFLFRGRVDCTTGLVDTAVVNSMLLAPESNRYNDTPPQYYENLVFYAPSELGKFQSADWMLRVHGYPETVRYTQPLNVPALTLNIPDTISISQGLVLSYSVSDAQYVQADMRTIQSGVNVAGSRRGADGKVSFSAEELQRNIQANQSATVTVEAVNSITQKVDAQQTKSRPIEFSSVKTLEVSKSVFLKP